MNDTIRIGASIINVNDSTNAEFSTGYLGTEPYTRELLLESLDNNAILIYETARELNAIMDLDTALSVVSDLMKRSMGADRGEVILRANFDKLSDMGFPESIAKTTIERQTAIVIPDMVSSDFGRISESASLLRIRSVLCVPVIANDDVIALIYMYKTDPNARGFDQQDLQLAVAISHQTAMTIQRMELLDKAKAEVEGRQILHKSLPPELADNRLGDFLQTGHLPGLDKRPATAMVVGIAQSITTVDQENVEQLTPILMDFYKTSADVIFKHKGVVKYHGDRAVAAFGLVDGADENHVTNGLEAAKELIAHYAEGFEGDDSFHLQVVLGVGDVISGYIGQKANREFAVFGDVITKIEWYYQNQSAGDFVIDEEIASIVRDDHEVDAIELKQEKDINAYKFYTMKDKE
jgi:class 3 adenylate cyclase